jgi:type IV fimbrial biogenesis protein FimT
MLQSGAATTVRDATMGIQNQVRLATAGITAVRFGGQGLGYKATDTSKSPYSSNTLADICSTMISSDNHRTVSIAAGSIFAVSKSTGACP